MTIDNLIEEEDIGLASLSVVLERAVISHVTEADRSLYVNETDMFPFWLELRPGPRFILLHSYLEFLPELSDEERLEFCDRINQQLYMPSVHVRHLQPEGEAESYRLVANYPVFYRDGLITSHLIRLCRLFSHSMKRIELEFDPEHERVREL